MNQSYTSKDQTVTEMARQWQIMERSFAVFVLTAGVLLLLLATTIVHDPHYGHLRGHLVEKSQHVARRQVGRVDSYTSVGPVDSYTQNKTADVVRPNMTDAVWMGLPVKPIRPFVTNQSHPFLKENVFGNEHLCGDGPVDLLIVIHSSVTHFQHRRVIRETWAARHVVLNVTIARVFVLGRTSTDVTQSHVNAEYATYRDIVQGDFTDSFANLTMKAVTALRWVNDHCPQARAVLKVDDDMFVNVFYLLEHVLGRLVKSQRTVLCHAKKADTSLIIRDPKSKWYVPPGVLPNRTHWPAFCSGYFVLMTTDCVPLLYRASYVKPYVPVDDAFVFGILPEIGGNSFLQYKDISPVLTFKQTALLEQYEHLHTPISLLAGSAEHDKAMSRLWIATLSRLSPWARSRAAFTSLHKTLSNTAGL